MELEAKDFIQKVNTYGNIPLAKFGHTCSLISENRLIVFGGASGNVGNYAITNDTFCLIMQMNPMAFTWRKLDSKIILLTTIRCWSGSMPKSSSCLLHI